MGGFHEVPRRPGSPGRFEVSSPALGYVPMIHVTGVDEYGEFCYFMFVKTEELRNSLEYNWAPEVWIEGKPKGTYTDGN